MPLRASQTKSSRYCMSLLRLLPLLTIVVDCLMDSAYDYLFVDGSIDYNDCLEITAKSLVLIPLCSFLLCSKVALLCPTLRIQRCINKDTQNVVSFFTLVS